MLRVVPRVRATVALTLLATLPVVASAQATASPLAIHQPDEGPFPFGASGAVDAAVPTPRQVLGYEIGERFTTYDLVQRYLERLAATSRRVRLDTLGHTFEGRAIVLAIVTSEANQGRLAGIQDAARQLAHPRAAGDVDAVAARTPAIAWLGFSIHGNEASGTEASLALLYHLAAFDDEATRMVLDSTVVLIDPIENIDGHERHVQDNLRMRGATGIPVTPGAMVHQGTWPGARTSHYYFDLNRDWFIQSHPESRARAATFAAWAPHVAVDLHEMGSNSTYFFAPPMAPFNKNVPPSILRWWDVYAASNAAAFDQHGWAYFRREGYDEFYPGYGVSWPTLTGAVGMTYEEASSSGGAIRRTDGTVLTLRQAAHHHYTAAWATLLTTARRRAERVRDYAEFRRSAVTDAAGAPMRAVVLERDAQGRADSLVRLLARNDIAVGMLAPGAQLSGATPYGNTRGAARLANGGYVVDLAQPQGRLAKALLEPDAQLDSTFISEELESRRTGRADRFYDVTAWSLPLTYRVRAWTTGAPPAGTTPFDPGPDAGSLGTADWVRRFGGAAPAAPARGQFGYAFAPGSEASLRLLGALLADGVRVWHAPRSFRVGSADFPQGAFVVRTAANDSTVHATVARLAVASGAVVAPLATALVDSGTDLGSNSVVPVNAPRVALLGGSPVQGNAFGFTWFALDQRLGYPVTTIEAGAVAGGLLRDFDVLVIPSVSAGGLDDALGEGGRQRLATWVRDGGVLLTLEGATGWLAREASGLSRLRAARVRPDSGAAPLPANVPGAIVRALADTLSPLLAGVNETELPVMVNGGTTYALPADLRPGEAVLRYAPEPRLRLAGYLWPEAPARLAGAPYLWTERVGRGRVIAFAGDPNYRDLWRGLLPVFANAVFLGGTF
jgi:hypothetical protein